MLQKFVNLAKMNVIVLHGALPKSLQECAQIGKKVMLFTVIVIMITKVHKR